MQDSATRSRPARIVYSCVIFLVLILATTCALAQESDQLGLYFDSEFTITSYTPDQLPTMVTGYLVLNNPSASGGVGGWECRLEVVGEATLVGVELAGQAINIFSEPEYMVGIGDAPLPLGDQVLLATLTLFVSESSPVRFQVYPIETPSIPGSMSYLNAYDMREILPMTTITGEPEIAYLNPNGVYCSVDVDHLSVGETFPNMPIRKEIEVSNPGFVPLQLFIELVDDTGGFRLTSTDGFVLVEPGESTWVKVTFEPPGIGSFQCTLQLGENCDDIPVEASCREPVTSWEAPSLIDCGEVAVGASALAQVVIHNTGEDALDLEWWLMDGSPIFSLTPFTIVPFWLPSGSSWGAIVHFAPDAVGPFNGTVYLGPMIGEVPIIGVGREPTIAWRVAPNPIVFDLAVQSELSSFSVSVLNEGEAPLELDISLPDNDLGFVIPTESTVNMGEGPHTIPVGQIGRVVIQLTAENTGLVETQLLLGGPIPPIDVSADVVPAQQSWIVSPTDLTFGPILSGSWERKTCSIANTGNVDLVIRPTDSSPHFSCIEQVSIIRPGENRPFSILFQPQAMGTWEATFNFGDQVTTQLHCVGEATWVPDEDKNVVGFFFDSELTNIDFVTGMHPGIPVYLALRDCSPELGIAAWECQADSYGEGYLHNWELMGNAVNELEAPMFKVSLDSPLPYLPGGIVLATAEVFVGGPQPVTLLLLPLYYPTLPHEMNWRPADDTQRWPMHTITGQPSCAFINQDWLSVEAPPPAVVAATGAQVTLQWDRPSGEFDTYRVMRRQGNAEALAVSGDLAPTSAPSISFTDALDEFSAGTMLYYSYALISDGEEIGRSSEVEVLVKSLPQSTTRLLPNVPNPFNPKTEIHFELAADGAVRITIFDVTGRRVRTLVSESLGAGPQSRTWHGKDDRGRQVPSGSYYVRLETDGRVDHRKVLLLK